jgi:hypothetical protein
MDRRRRRVPFAAPLQWARAAMLPRGGHGAVALSLGLLVVTLWLVTRPYQDIVGDSRFYTVQALDMLMPRHFSEDLYFRYGSQDRFTLFSRIYGPFIRLLGLSWANIILTVIGQCLWVGGLISLAGSMFRDRKLMLIAIVMAIVLPADLDMLRSGEPVLTPRLFAEAITLGAMGCMLRGHPMRALLLLCVSVTVHPLMTLPGIAVLFFYEALTRRILWLFGGGAIVGIMGLALAGIQPFAMLFLQFDPTWFAIVHRRDFFCFLDEWGIGQWLRITITFALAALGFSFAEPAERRFLGTVFGVAIGGFAVALIGGDILRDVLIVDIQPWRSAWLLAVVAHLMMGSVLLRIQKRGVSVFTNAVFLFVFSLILIALSGFMPAFYAAAAPMALMTCLVGTWEHSYQHEISTIVKILIFVCVGIVCGISVICAFASLSDLTYTPYILVQTMLGLALTVGALSILMIYFSGPIQGRKLLIHPTVMLCLAMILVTVGGWNWDQRSPWVKFLDTTNVPPPSLTALLPGDSPIYWEGDVRVPWLVLRRASYFSYAQGTGALFNRGTAIGYQSRYDDFRKLGNLDLGEHSFIPDPMDIARAPLNRKALASVCKKEPGLGAIVLTHPALDDAGAVWKSPTVFEDAHTIDGKGRVFRTDHFFIYTCSALRT